MSCKSRSINYKCRCRVKTSEEILSRFKGERRQFLHTLFTCAVKKKVWFTMDIDQAVQKTGSPRKRIITAFDYLEQKGDLELKVSGPRLGFRRIAGQDIDIPAIKEKLVKRFVTREKNDIRRLQQVVEMVNHAGCKTRFLMSYFGEDIEKDCGHCSLCLNGENAPIERGTAGAERLDFSLMEKLHSLRKKYPEALQSPRQMTRFLCGLSSPLLIKNKLGKHELFG